MFLPVVAVMVVTLKQSLLRLVATVLNISAVLCCRVLSGFTVGMLWASTTSPKSHNLRLHRYLWIIQLVDAN